MEAGSSKKKAIRLIGDYLAERCAGTVLPIEQTLRQQAALERQGIYEPLGNILAEKNGIERPVLEECLLAQRADILAAVPLFETLPRDVLLEVARSVTTVVLPPGAPVYRASDVADRYFVIASGGVRVFRQEEAGAEVTVARRGQGEGFGEIALLTGKPHASCVETLERTGLIIIPSDVFLKTVFSHPPAAQTCARILAERLSSGYGRIASVSFTEQAYRQFIADQLRKEEPLFIGNSPLVMNLVKEIEALSGSDSAVLIAGEPGTEMRDVAGLLHEMSRKERGLFMGMDATSGDGADGEAAAGNEQLILELNQFGTLFGRGHNALPFAPDRRLGLLTMAAGGTVVIENVEHLTPRVQAKIADYLEGGRFAAVGEQEVLRSDARIVATTSADLAAMAAAGTFDQRLHDLIAARTLTVPPLRRRKRDLGIIVGELIKRNNRQLGKSIQGIDEEAYRSLMGYDWPGNTEELRVVIRRAVSIAKGDRLMLEDIFIGPPPITGKYTIDLLKAGPVQRIVQSRFYPYAAHFVTIPFIAVIVALGLFGPQDPDRNLALILTWGLWEPMLVAGAFFTGRMWCSVCPIGAISRLVNRTAGLGRKVPSWIRNNGFYFSAAGIAAIFWIEAATHMTRSPRATALLVVPLVALAALAGFLFQRRTWCRYLCPLGGMMGVLGSTAVVEMRSNYAVCNSTCVRHECYAGDGDREGCPMFEGPFALRSNRTCMLCGNCVKVCPNHSPVLNLRLPGYELWTVRSPDRIFFVLTLVLMGTQVFRGMEDHELFQAFLPGGAFVWWAGTLTALAGSVLLAWGFALLAGRVLFDGADTGAGEVTYRTAYVLLPLIFAFEAGFHLERLLLLAGQFLPVLGRQMGLDGELPGASAPLWLSRSLQALLLLAGSAASVWVLSRHRRLLGREGGATGRAWPVFVLLVVYLVLLLGA